MIMRIYCFIARISTYINQYITVSTPYGCHFDVGDPGGSSTPTGAPVAKELVDDSGSSAWKTTGLQAPHVVPTRVGYSVITSKP